MRAKDSNEAKERKRPGPKPKTPEEKAAAAAARAAEKAKAESMTPEIFLEYQGSQTDLAALAEAAKADFRTVKKRTLVTDLKLYVVPEQKTAYYVINGEYKGQISF